MAVTAAEFATWTQEWQSSLRAVRSALPPPPPPGSACWEDAEPWRALACSRLHPGGTCSDSPLRARECDRSCGRCTASAPPRPVVAPSAASSCALVAHRHIAKTGGASVRDWMFQLDKRGEGRFYGPATWMRWKGRCQIGRYLHCCNPTDERPTAKCEALRLVEARAIAVELLANASARGRDGGRGDGGLGAAGLTMLEFHWPDSALGKWGKPGPSEEKALARSPPGLAEAGAFLRLLPFMRPHALPGCRVVTATVLREPAALYPSLMRHQLGSMRTYGFETLSARCGCNLTACDAVGFVAAFPDFQGWRLTSARWLYPPLASVGHRRMYRAASSLLDSLDLVGVTERLSEFTLLLCAHAGIGRCPTLGHLNQKRTARGAEPGGDAARCRAEGDAASDAALRGAVERHALADVWLHGYARRRFAATWTLESVAA